MGILILNTVYLLFLFIHCPILTINPGAVDAIIHLGDFWNEAGIRRNRIALIDTSERIGAIFARAYNYLAAADKMYDNVCAVSKLRVRSAEFYKIAARIIGDELAHRELSPEQGLVKRFFASAITPLGIENFISVLTEGYQKVYILQTPIGIGCERILDLFLESALYRGFDAEAYYCPMKPGSKIEHLLIPDLSVAILTSNSYHKVLPSDCSGDVVMIDLDDMVTEEVSPFQKETAKDCLERMDELIKKAVQCLATAKKEHDLLETFYIPNMDFAKIDTLRMDIENQIRER